MSIETLEYNMINGSIVALVTPFKDGELDEQALVNMVNWHLSQGTHGIVPVGTTGESATLSEKEHCRVIELVVQAVDGRVPVIAGAGSNNTSEAIYYQQRAQELGADATLHMAGYYNRPSQEGLYRHFEALSAISTIPIIVYNNPPRSTVDILPETMARIAALPNVAGVKDATANLTRPVVERMHIGDDFLYLSGEDGSAVAYNAAGGDGCISVSANVAPALCAELQAACRKDDFRRAMAIQQRLMPLHLAMFMEPSPAGAKYAVSLLGLCEEGCRLPIIPLKDTTKNLIQKVMKDLELI
jgi:4-hydroxy-tetrahydrodipicolinate synthase